MTRNRRQTGGAILAVLADYVSDWQRQHQALERILDIVYPARSVSARLDMVSALAEVMDLDPILNRGRLDKLADVLLQQGYSSALIRRAYKLSSDSPWGRDWRSEKGTRPPSEKALRDTISQFTRVARRDDVVDLDG